MSGPGPEWLGWLATGGLVAAYVAFVAFMVWLGNGGEW